MAGLIAVLLGAMVGVWLLSALLDWSLLKRLGLRPKTRIVLSSLAAVVAAVVLYGFGHADGGEWNPGEGFFTYPFAGLMVCVIRLYRSTSDGAPVESG
jgi:hypothetical protein